uniref:zinc finger protein 57-like n=1 Tax=Vespula vulgaris TaxID=7454 RepID=UPI00223AC272|nr:zinc finger protein 57-like [Vespula vulgaris]
MKNFLCEICEICNRDILFSNVIENSRNFDFPTKTIYLQKNWVCFQCGKRYLWRGSLKNHMRVECGKEPTFKCPVCGRKFKHKHRWQSHAKCVHHIDLLPKLLKVRRMINLPQKKKSVIHKCTRCGKSYQLYTSLRRHLRLECGVEPKETCPICGKKFTHRFKLTSHLSSCGRKRGFT